jgi:hypothetical protein
MLLKFFERFSHICPVIELFAKTGNFAFNVAMGWSVAGRGGAFVVGSPVSIPFC